jgi:hypothetical protein
MRAPIDHRLLFADHTKSTSLSHNPIIDLMKLSLTVLPQAIAVFGSRTDPNGCLKHQRMCFIFFWWPAGGLPASPLAIRYWISPVHMPPFQIELPSPIRYVGTRSIPVAEPWSLMRVCSYVRTSSLPSVVRHVGVCVRTYTGEHAIRDTCCLCCVCFRALCAMC